jgi:hypothetical protein
MSSFLINTGGCFKVQTYIKVASRAINGTSSPANAAFSIAGFNTFMKRKSLPIIKQASIY